MQPSSHEAPLRIAIIGGSLGGLFAALALQRAGFEVNVYERSKGTLQTKGAGLRMQADMLERLRTAGIEVDSNGLSPPLFRFLGPDNTVVYEERANITYTSWARLYDMLLEAVGTQRYHLDANALDIEQRPGGATVRFTNGTSVDADLVVAADGLSSSVRQWLAPDEVPSYAGYVCWRGIVAQDKLSPDTRALLHGAGIYVMPERGHMSIYPIPGNSAQPDYAIVWYRPIAPADLPQLMVDRTGKQRDWSVPAGWVPAPVVEALRADARRELPPAAAEVLLKIADPFIQVIVDVEASRMLYGRVCIVADAAFSGRPHLGAGTAKAAADAWTLAQALCGTPRSDVDAALAAWESARMEIGRRYVQTNRELGNALVEGRVAPEQFTSRASWERLLQDPLPANAPPPVQ